MGRQDVSSTFSMTLILQCYLEKINAGSRLSGLKLLGLRGATLVRACETCDGYSTYMFHMYPPYASQSIAVVKLKICNHAIIATEDQTDGTPVLAEHDAPDALKTSNQAQLVQWPLAGD